MHMTLAERLKDAMNGPPKVTGKALAAACHVSTASVSDWLSGKSKTMEGSNLLAAADFLHVSPKWLATGVGIKYANTTQTSHHVSDNGPDVAYLERRKTDKNTSELLALFGQLDTNGKSDLLIFVRGFVAGRRPHSDGKASALAG